MYLSNALGAICLLAMSCAVLDAGEFYINDVQVSGHQFLAIAAVPLSIVAVLALGIGYALSQDSWWSRHLILLFWAVLLAFGLVAAVSSDEPFWRSVSNVLLAAGIPAGSTAGYLFFKANVVAYYDARRPVGT